MRVIYLYLGMLISILLLATCKALSDVNWASKKRDIVVLVIDTGYEQSHNAFKTYNIKCPEPQDCADIHGHGTHVMSLVTSGEIIKKKATSPICDNVIIYSCDYQPLMMGERWKYCLKMVRELRPDFVNYSSSGITPSIEEYHTILNMPDTTWVVATGNDGVDLLENPVFPAMYTYTNKLAGSWKELESLKNIIPVGALTRDDKRWDRSNTIPNQQWILGVSVIGAGLNGEYQPRTGTSMATALYTNKLIRKKCNEL